MPFSLDYYAILGVPKDATKVDICRAYKALALQFHPDLKHQNINKAYKKFILVSEAFDILYDDEKRRVYDQHGQQKLKEGVVNQKGERELGNYTFTLEPEAIFEKFFGSRNVYEHLLTVGQGEGRSHPIFSSQYDSNGSKINEKNQHDLVVQVRCGLSELFNGCKKTLTYPKQVLSADGQQVQTIQETKTIDISAGASQKWPIVFKGQGNQQPGDKPSNLVFQIIEVPEMGYSRDSDDPEDLIYTAKISLVDALDSKSIQVKQLNGEIIQLQFDEIISPQTQRIVEKRGMPHYDKNESRGDLLVKFDIIFPEQIQIEKKARLVELLTAAQ